MLKRLRSVNNFFNNSNRLTFNKYSIVKHLQSNPNFNINAVSTLRLYSWFASEHKYSNKTTRQIQKQIAMQKWKTLQNTFKSLNSTYGLKKPTSVELQNTKYMKPTKIQYTLQTLRECSHSYSTYLYWELEKDGSPFNQLITKIIDNLWKAEEKETLDFLEFLYAWEYKKINLKQLYERIIQKYELNMDQLFKLLKKFDGSLYKTIEIKVLKRLEKSDLNSNEYSSFFRIINYFTVKELLSEHFYLAAVRLVKDNINRIPPTQALDAYVYYTYNINEHVSHVSKGQDQKQKQASQREDLGINIVKIIQNRILSPECLKFYNGGQLTAFLHTFLKNNLILNDQSHSEQYEQKVNKIINRVELGYFSQDFSTRDKQKLLQICSLLPKLKKQIIIALVQRQLFKKKQKFDYQLLPSLLLISYQNNMLTEELKDNIYKGVINNIFHIDKKDISRLLWLFTLTGITNIGSILKKVQTIIEGGFRDLTIKDICIIVWSMSAANYNENGKFWDNIQSFLYEELNRLKAKGGKKQKKQVNPQKSPQSVDQKVSNRKLVNECSWILWAYHNNRELRMQIIDMVSNIILEQFSTDLTLNPNKLRLNIEEQNMMTVFELTSITSFYYSINFPALKVIEQIKKICYEQFKKVMPSMESIQLCKCLKYVGAQVWKDKQLTNRVITTFEQQVDTIAYRDIMSVVAILISSGIKNKRITELITRLLEKKKRLESVQQYGTEVAEEEKPNKKQSIWRFPI